jgi:DNA repair photolyase
MEHDRHTIQYLKGRGAQINTANRFNRHSYAEVHIEGLDEPLIGNEPTRFFYDYPKQIVNEVDSPDIPLSFSMNPYQGCEHGCAYCYARNVHTYWGLSAGIDFERKIIIKPEAPRLLEKTFQSKSWRPAPIMLSGNTDCYQPVEQKTGLTRKLLEVCLKYKNPVGVITKNSLINRDIDLLADLAKHHLVHVMISVTTLNNALRQIMEPRTATIEKRLHTIQALNNAGVPCGVMTAPIIPGLNSDEIPMLLKEAANHGALQAGYTLVRLNGDVKDIFKNWLYQNFPDRADKVWHLIESCHGGNVSDSVFGRRIKGGGKVAESISLLFKIAVKKYFVDRTMPPYNTAIFSVPGCGNQLSLF